MTARQDHARQITRDELPGLLEGAGVGANRVSLYGAHDHDRVVIDHRADGWAVFYSERGAEYELQLHESEDAACRDLLGRLGVTIGIDRT